MLKKNTLRHWGRLIKIYDTFGTSLFTWDKDKQELRQKHSGGSERLFHLLSISNCLSYISFLSFNISIMKHSSVSILEIFWGFNYLGLYLWGLTTSLNTAVSSSDVARFLRGVTKFDKNLSGKRKTKINNYNNLCN